MVQGQYYTNINIFLKVVILRQKGIIAGYIPECLQSTKFHLKGKNKY